MSKPPIKIGLPRDVIAPNDQTGQYPSNKYTVDDFNSNGQPAFLDSLDRLPYIDAGTDFVFEDGSVSPDLTTFMHLLKAAAPDRQIPDAGNERKIATAWVLDICDGNLAANVRGEVLNWSHVIAFTNPDQFNTQVPVGIKNSLWTDPEGVEPDRQKYWFEMSQGNRDIGYWRPDGGDPTVPQTVAWPAWFTDGVALPGRNAWEINELAGIQIQSTDNWEQAQANQTWEVITQDKLTEWGWVVP